MARKPTVATQKRQMTRKRLVVIVALSLVVILFILLSPYGLITRLSLRSAESDLEERIAVQRQQEDSLRGVVLRLRTDTTEIERLAREKYGYVRPGEEVFIIKQQRP
jgi:cell division protein FtsB